MSFGTKLKMLRTLNKLDQSQMIKKLHTSQPVYSRYENDLKQVDISHHFVKAVAKEFNVDPNWLVSSTSDILDVERNADKDADNREISSLENGINDNSEIRSMIEVVAKQQEVINRLIARLVPYKE